MSGGRMTGGRVAAPQPNAGQLAMALVAAAKIFGIAPDAVFVGNQTARRTRILAGAALKASTGCAANHLATTLRLKGPELAPSMVTKAGVTTDMMLEVVECLHGGLPQPSAKAKSDARPLAPATEAKRAPCKAAPKPKAGQSKPSAVEPVAKAASPVAPAAAVAAPMRYAVPPRQRSRPEPKAPETTAPSAIRPSAVQRLKPMTATKLRFARWFVAAGWDAEEVAELFDVHEDALADALEFGVAA